MAGLVAHQTDERKIPRAKTMAVSLVTNETLKQCGVVTVC